MSDIEPQNPRRIETGKEHEEAIVRMEWIPEGWAKTDVDPLESSLSRLSSLRLRTRPAGSRDG